MNLHAIAAIYSFEMKRTLRTLMQSIAAPVISTSLYFVVFGSAIGSRMVAIEGISYGAFIVPGLIMLSILTESISNASFGIYMPKFSGTIYEVLSAPVDVPEIVLGYVGAAATKSILLGLLILGTAGSWFLLDYVYYGNTISTPRIIELITPNASEMTTITIQLAIFAVAAVPGYILAIARMDRIGHRRLQLIGFILMGVCFAVISLVPSMTTMVVPFLMVYGVSYFFTEFGPNVTTFVLPGELFPTSVRATGHGISAGIGKFGAFIGVFLFPVLQSSLGLRGTLLLTAGVSVLGALLTLVLPEPAGLSLEEISGYVTQPEVADMNDETAVAAA